MDYKVLSDGWIKIPAADFPLGEEFDQQERLIIGLNQVLIRKDGKNILIDTGLGEKWQPGDVTLLDFEQPRGLTRNLLQNQVKREDVDFVILTHLHYDHAGGSTDRDEAGEAKPAFPKAVYYVQQAEYVFAEDPGSKYKTDYMPEDWKPLVKSGQLQLVVGDEELISGISVFLAPGHTPGHQVVLVQDDEATLFFPGDLFSTPKHANLLITTAYDMDGEILVKSRQKWLPRAITKKWDCVFCHNIRNPVGRIPQEFLNLK